MEGDDVNAGGYRIGLVGFRFDENSSFMRGAADAPPLIREALFSDASNLWSETGVDLGQPGVISDAGDVGPGEGAGMLEAVEGAVEGLLARDLRPLSLGGDHSFPQREIQESAYQYQKAVERGDQTIVGVNKYAMGEEPTDVDILVIDEAVRDHQIKRLERVRAQRDRGAVENSLEKLRRAARAGDNTMPATIEAVRAYATLGEICSALRDVYGIYEEPAF